MYQSTIQPTVHHDVLQHKRRSNRLDLGTLITSTALGVKTAIISTSAFQRLIYHLPMVTCNLITHKSHNSYTITLSIKYIVINFGPMLHRKCSLIFSTFLMFGVSPFSWKKNKTKLFTPSTIQITIRK